MPKKNSIEQIVKTYALCLKSVGGISEFLMNKSDNIGETFDTINIPKSFKRSKGIGKLTRQHDFLFNEKIISVYAWNDGEAGWENKNELPHPIENNLYFGNIYMIAHLDNTQVDITLNDFDKFTTQYFGDIEDIGSEDSWSSEESSNSDDSINDFIVPG